MMMSLTTLYLEQVDDDEPEDGGAAGEEGEGGVGQEPQVTPSLITESPVV